MVDPGKGLRIVCSNERFAIGSWRNVHLVVTRGMLTPVDIRYTDQVHANLRTLYPEGSAVLCVIEAAKVPSTNVRAEAVRSFRESGPDTLCCAIVLEDQGFRGVAVRSALSTIFLVSRRPCPCCIFKETAEAVAWTLTRIADSVDERTALLEAVAQLRSTPYAH